MRDKKLRKLQIKGKRKETPTGAGLAYSLCQGHPATDVLGWQSVGVDEVRIVSAGP